MSLQSYLEGISVENTKKIYIEIISAYDEIAWYSKLIGERFEVLAFGEGGDVKIKKGEGRYSYWIGNKDYKIVQVAA
ncbi:hypothetical protein CN918_28885 [Priestia megaterium]|nr:hypothetical protein CN918_28885 [Priestia megaterium]